MGCHHECRVRSPTNRLLILNAVSQVDAQTFEIDFDLQTEGGIYTIAIGPEITDLAGNLMDQDQDGNPGEPSDAAVGQFFMEKIETVFTFESTDGPKSIGFYRFYGPTISTIDVDTAVTIGELDVQIDIDHNYLGDLWVALYGPSGEGIWLVTGEGGAGSNFNETIFDDDAGVSIINGQAPFNGSYSPESALSSFNGQDARGRWTLAVYDTYFLTNGQLHDWSLTITEAPTAQGGSTPALSQGTSLAEGLPNGTLLPETVPVDAAGFDLRIAEPNPLEVEESAGNDQDSEETSLRVSRSTQLDREMADDGQTAIERAAKKNDNDDNSNHGATKDGLSPVLTILLDPP